MIDKELTFRRRLLTAWVVVSAVIVWTFGYLMIYHWPGWGLAPLFAAYAVFLTVFMRILVGGYIRLYKEQERADD